MKPLGRILWLWRGRAFWLLLGLVASLAAVAAGVALSAVAGAVLGTSLLVGGALLAPLALRWLGVARVVGRYLERLLTHEATFRALADLRVWFFQGLARGAAGGLGFRQAGDVLARLVGDVEALDGLYLRILVPLAAALLLLPALAVLIGGRAPWLGAVVCLCLALASFALPWGAARAAMAAGDRLAATESGLRVAALDTLTGLREVRAFGAEGRMLAFVQAREAALLAAQRELAGRTAWANAGALLCAQAAVLAVLLSAGAAPAGAVAAAFLTVAAFEAVGGLPRAGALAGRAAAAARRVWECAETPPAVPEPAHPIPVPRAAALRFDGVRFRWQPDHPPVFDGLTLDVPEGARVALLGPSGSGKSTLAALALRLVAPEAGRVRLGGTDVALMASAELRARIGWLSQATHLFDDTIRANLLLARPEADEAALWAALDAAQIADTVRTLPDGLDTWVGEGGTRFSGGQGRRLALARTLLSPAPLLILDEPTAGLDAETERAFLATLNEAAAGRTVLLIAHRLTGVERLDRIWRLTAGHAVAAAG
ncbi:MAG TPA: thiol reductant ABC exporter subunit CydC [Acetobacteraceae bacterium]|nr:thiol reductant ABC exporter subunit CydC [Acetobacteraceae bacterium]